MLRETSGRLSSEPLVDCLPSLRVVSKARNCHQFDTIIAANESSYTATWLKTHQCKKRQRRNREGLVVL